VKKLKALNVKSVLRVSLVLGVVAGTLVGTILMISDMVAGRVMEGLFTFVMAPLIYGVMGALVNAFMALIYNLVAQRLGGIELDLE
jgi:hypothetical protein